MKADRQDAQLLARYLEREVSELLVWAPITPAQQEFWRLLKYCATVVREKVQLQHNLVDLASLQADVDALLKNLDPLLHEIDRVLLADAKCMGWAAQVERCPHSLGWVRSWRWHWSHFIIAGSLSVATHSL